MDRGGIYAEEHATLALTHIYFVECCILIFFLKMETNHCLHSQNGAELERLLATCAAKGEVKKILLSVKKSEPAIDFTEDPGSH